MKRGCVFILAAVWLCGAGIASAAERPLRLTASAVIGFDNNPELTAARDEDFFLQESVGAKYKQRLSDRLRLRVSAVAVNVNYFHVSAADVTAADAGAGLDVLLRPGTILETDYGLTYVDFPESNLSSQFENRLRAGIRQRLTDRFELRSGYGVSVQDFIKRRIGLPDGHVSDTTEREDMRHTLDLEFGFLAAPQVLLKAGCAYFFNDSNEPSQTHSSSVNTLGLYGAF